MQRSVVVAAALLLVACQSSTALDEGERLSWRCDGDKNFSLRHVSGDIEVFAGGETNRLAARGEGQYSNGEITYAEAGGGATLTGANGGPYENCRRRAGDWWFRFW